MRCAWCKEPKGSQYYCTKCSVCKKLTHGCHSRYWVTEEDFKNNDFTKHMSYSEKVREDQRLVCWKCVHDRREYKTRDGEPVKVDQDGKVLQDYPCSCGTLCRGYTWEYGRMRMTCGTCFDTLSR
jgi:hypothetical protein